jgi:hypothetical protein
MRLEGRLRLGYFPLPPVEGDKIRSMLQFPSTSASVLDPCAGEGRALHQLTAGGSVRQYGVELDAGRAEASRTAGIDVIHGNVFETAAKSGQFSMLYLNPPYDTEVGRSGNQRMEYLFLDHTFHWLKKQGVLLMVIPFEAVMPCAGILARNFRKLQIFALDDPEATQYNQVAIFGIYDRVSHKQAEEMTRWIRFDCSKSKLPVLRATNFPEYQVPPSERASILYKGLPLDQVEDRLVDSPSWEHISNFFTPGRGVTDARPLTPLHAGHVGLMCTSGLMNGVLGEGDNRHIAQWRSIKHVDESIEENEDGSKIVKRSERFSTELACVYQDGRVFLLTETPNANPEIKEEEEDVPESIEGIEDEPELSDDESFGDGTMIPATFGARMRRHGRDFHFADEEEPEYSEVA